MSQPPGAAIHHDLQERLLALSPRGFELFAGDLLVYIGLQNVAITQYVSDGGIDAHGDLLAESGLVRVPTGVQVKRLRHNVQRPDIDRFIGALSEQFFHGIFITTSAFAPKAQEKARASRYVRIDTIDGAQLSALMLRHSLGVMPGGEDRLRLDEAYFSAFDAQSPPAPPQLKESPAPYHVDADAPDALPPPAPADDLISLSALSYALRVDTTTLRRWIEQGRLTPDREPHADERTGFFFQRRRIDEIRRTLLLDTAPRAGMDWRLAFQEYFSQRKLTRSYKPVLIKALIKLVDRNGEAALDAITVEFWQFYIQRQQRGLLPEQDGILADPQRTTLDAVKQLIVRFPLDRFRIQQLLEYDEHTEIVRFAPPLWQALRYYDLLDALQTADAHLDYYFRTRLGSSV